MSWHQVNVAIRRFSANGGQRITDPEQLPEVYDPPDGEGPASGGDLQVVVVGYVSCAVVKKSWKENQSGNEFSTFLTSSHFIIQIFTHFKWLKIIYICYSLTKQVFKHV